MTAARFATFHILLILAIGPLPAAAQTRLYLLVGGATHGTCMPADCEAGQLVEIDIDARRLARITPVLHARYFPRGLHTSPDGRYLFWIGSEAATPPSRISMFEPTTGAYSVATTLVDSSYRLFSHPSAFRAFLSGPEGLLIAEPGSLRSLPVASCAQPRLMTMSLNGARLFVQCTLSSSVRAIDSASGTQLGSVPVSSTYSTTFAPNGDGTVLFTATTVTGAPPELAKWDVGANALVAQRPVGAAGESAGRMAVDPRTGRLWVGMLRGGIDIVDPNDLTAIARVPTTGVAHIVFDPQHPVAIVVSNGAPSTINPPSLRFRSDIYVVDTDSLAVTLTATLPFTSGVAGMVLAPRPPRPSALSASVAGGQVSLQWSIGTGAPGSSTFVDAGSAPGLTNLASLAVAPGQTTFVAQGVPPGTYYVRVRTQTAGGVEAVSNEIAVTVR